MIEIKGLHKIFNRGKANELRAVDGLSLSLPDRGMVAVFGKSGCGKTTLLNLIGGLDRPTEGAVTILGKNLADEPDGIRCRHIGYIFQNYHLLKGESCFENVASALYLSGMRDAGEISRRVTAALRSVGMEKFASRTPDTLSGGQQQRIAIARAIVKAPRIILADEPTGNLDEANTVMIMELLRALANERLVLLVTHEQELARRYCDEIVELSDGKLVCIRENEASGGKLRSKNDIWLGELPRRELSDGDLSVASYGEPIEHKLLIRLVSLGGKLYLRVDDPAVHILDEASEIRLREGRFEESGGEGRAIDTSALLPIEGKRCGRLFGFASSLRESAGALLGKRRRTRRLLSRCMCLLSVALVLMTAVFGSAFAKLGEIERAYHHSVFYAYDADGSVSRAVKASDGAPRVAYSRPVGSTAPERVTFETSFFETFYDYSASEISTEAVLLIDALLSGERALCGKVGTLGEGEVVITRGVAEALLKSSPLDFLDSAEDLIGLAMTEPLAGLRIVGVTKSREPAVYLSAITAAEYALRDSATAVARASLSGASPAVGHALLALRAADKGISYPKVGETVTIHGSTLTVDGILRYARNYDEWLLYSGVPTESEQAYLARMLASEHPDLTPEGGDEYYLAYEDCRNRYYYAWAAAYYAHLDRYVAERHLFSPDLLSFLVLEKGVAEAKGQLVTECNGDELLAVEKYRQEHGRYPTLSEVEEGALLRYEKPSDVYLREAERYRDEFYQTDLSLHVIRDSVYLLSDEDYCAVAEGLGETDPSALSYGAQRSWILFYSTDPMRTAAYLKESFPALWLSEDGGKLLITPDTVRAELLGEARASIVSNLIALAVSLAVMSASVYFVMRSSLLSRIREIGIYRAIGASRGNLVFRFLVEALTLTTVTALPGYLVTSALLLRTASEGSMLSALLYYPIPLALSLLALLYGVCLLSGILPVLRLLRKTPSEILAKYDI